jgi:hypothetical protein
MTRPTATRDSETLLDDVACAPGTILCEDAHESRHVYANLVRVVRPLLDQTLPFVGDHADYHAPYLCVNTHITDFHDVDSRCAAILQALHSALCCKLMTAPLIYEFRDPGP